MSPYNQDTRSLPPTYGAYAKIYTDLKPGAGGKIVPATDGHYLWSIRVNAVYGEPADSSSARRSSTTSRSRSSTNSGTNDGDGSRRPRTSHSTRCWGAFPRTSTNSVGKVRRPRQGQPAAVREADQRRISRRPRRRRSRISTSENASDIAEANQGDKVRIARDMVTVDERQAKRSRHLRSIASDTRTACRKSRRSAQHSTEHRHREPVRRVPGIGQQPHPHSRLQGGSGAGRAREDGRAAVDRRRRGAAS